MRRIVVFARASIVLFAVAAACLLVDSAMADTAQNAAAGTEAAPQAVEALRPISERFAEAALDGPADESPGAQASTDEVPDFRRHIVPLVGRLGCNGRACHGSFQGQAGFRLSLFGYDFKSDHEALTKGDAPRVDLEKPADSLILRKPTLAEEHDGGRRFARDGWEYRVLHRWIASGAKPMATPELKLDRLEITPREIVFRKSGETSQLKIVAHWSDGSSENVTPISRFRTNDESIAKIDETGKITATGVGDTHVVAFYDSGVTPIPVLMPVSDQTGERYPVVAAPTKIDELVIAKLRKLGIVPSEPAADAEFLRRVSLDITGTLPTPDEIVAFLADSSPDKRERKIDELLERPAYAAWWATRLCDLTGNNPATMRQLLVPAGEEWFNWLYERINENAAYDKIVEGLLLAVSRQPGQSYEDFCRELSTYYGPGKSGDFTKRATMPHYWARQNFRNVDDRAVGFCYSFMGIQIQCAQCHKHPFDQWTKEDFDQFKPLFARVRYGVAPGTQEESNKMLVELGLEPDPKKRGNNNQFQNQVRKMAGEGKVVPHQEVFLARASQPPVNRKNANNPRRNRANAERPGQYAKLLGGEKLDLTKFDDERQALMDWLRNDPKRYLARALVNRVWANYFNVGIIHPTDDMNLANPPSNAELLDYLAAGVVDHQYDMKWLHREICRSQTYQRSWKPNETNKLDTRNFSRAVPRRLAAEVAYDAVVTATAGDDELKKLAGDARSRTIGLGNLAGLNRGAGGARANYALAVFGRPARATNCDCERSAEPSLLQTIYLQNDQETLSFIERGGGWLKQTERALTAPEKAAVKATPVAFNKPGAEAELSSDGAVTGDVKVRKSRDKASATEESAGAATARRVGKVTLVQLERRLKRLKAENPDDKPAIDKLERRIRRLREQATAETGRVVDAKTNIDKKPSNESDAKQGETAKSNKDAGEATATAKVAAKAPVPDERLAAVIREAYLRTVSREPTQAETARSIQHVREAASPATGLRDVLWALLNTKEFIVNH